MVCSPGTDSALPVAKFLYGGTFLVILFLDDLLGGNHWTKPTRKRSRLLSAKALCETANGFDKPKGRWEYFEILGQDIVLGPFEGLVISLDGSINPGEVGIHASLQIRSKVVKDWLEKLFAGLEEPILWGRGIIHQFYQSE